MVKGVYHHFAIHNEIVDVGSNEQGLLKSLDENV